ncbi:unnamed protein product [Macrosiphum euphorbiae]|uniref:Transposase domain-containing protein n=1 Tax=Macrosiphum euphorbiae TaxID=13131 RepID=A0AAV0X1W2_9HEMI|nr:unnamed protein product [Macrosiphum euphorbiae]
MHRINHLSKSTKRRRILNEQILNKHLIEIDSIPNREKINNDNIKVVINSSVDPSTNVCESSTTNELNTAVININHDTLEDKADDCSNFSDSESDEYIPQEQPLPSKLANWAINHNVPNNTFTDLLKILKYHKCFNNFPTDARTIYHNYSNVSYNQQIDVKTVPPGIYYHFGISNGIKKYIDKYFSCDNIKLVIGVDGLPLTKSSSSTFWPILGYIRQESQIVFPIGIYWGNEKPSDSNIFLKDFLDEINDLILNGISIEVFDKNNKSSIVIKKVIIDAFCCDSPAKAFLLKIKGHTGFYSCTKCTVEGTFLQRRVCFPNLNCTKRTHKDFVDQNNEQYHPFGNVSEIINIPNFDIIENFPLDYMHLVCLGVVKKMLMLWKGSGDIGRVNVNIQKMPLNVIKIISTRLLLIKKDIPCDFGRKPRSLDELARWKATEFRQFLLYTGIIVLHSIIPNEVYDHFLCLHVAMIIFLSPNYNNLSTFANSLLTDFVNNFGSLYGVHFISHNIHGLIHLYDDYKKFGCLDQVSCFKFENYMSQLKKMVRKQDKPLQQVVRRYQEHSIQIVNNTNLNDQPIFEMSHIEGPLIDGTDSPQFKVLILEKMKIKIHSDADSYVGININGALYIIKIVNICYSVHLKRAIVLGRKFETLENFFNHPLESSKLGIYKVNGFSKVISVWNICEITTKYIVSTTDQGFTVAIPIIHFEN